MAKKLSKQTHGKIKNKTHIRDPKTVLTGSGGKGESPK